MTCLFVASGVRSTNGYTRLPPTDAGLKHSKGGPGDAPLASDVRCSLRRAGDLKQSLEDRSRALAVVVEAELHGEQRGGLQGNVADALARECGFDVLKDFSDSAQQRKKLVAMFEEANKRERSPRRQARLEYQAGQGAQRKRQVAGSSLPESPIKSIYYIR